MSVSAKGQKSEGKRRGRGKRVREEEKKRSERWKREYEIWSER